MKKYLFIRILKSIFSILVVVSIVIVMVYKLVPTTKMFGNDAGYQRLKGIDKKIYEYNQLERLGYLDYVTTADMCSEVYGEDGLSACLAGENTEDAYKAFEDRGYTIEVINDVDEKGQPATATIGYRYYNPIELIVNFYSKLIVIDNPWAVEDANNPDLERKYYIGQDQNGIPALMCSGCNYKYQIYFDGSFPFIHQNIIELDLGDSYPTRVGVSTVSIIYSGQGSQSPFMQTFPTGVERSSALMQHTCRYKANPDHMDTQLFTDNYASCDARYDAPSMVNTSLIMGFISLVLAYIIALPFGVAMARNKDKLVDKIGIVYINLLIAVPSLAVIFFLKYIGSFFTLPDRFPQLGFGDIRSYIMPIIILALISTPSLMMWARRYMVDQSNADYVKFARAKGLSQKEIYTKHILKNAIIPIVNGIPQSVVSCLSGALITETMFSIPGMGKLLPDSIKQLNINMVLTLTLLFTTLSVIAVICGDILITVVDPRIQLAAKGD